MLLRLAVLFSFVATTLGLEKPAFAVLGGAANPHFKLQKSSTGTGPADSCYSVYVHEKDGVYVKEFIDIKSKKVFATRMTGMSLPLKDHLTSEDFDSYSQEAPHRRVYSRNHAEQSRHFGSTHVQISKHGLRSSAFLLKQNLVPACVKDLGALE